MKVESAVMGRCLAMGAPERQRNKEKRCAYVPQFLTYHSRRQATVFRRLNDEVL